MRRFAGSFEALDTRSRLRGLPAPQAFAGRELLYRGWIANRAALRTALGDLAPADPAADDGALFAAADCRWGDQLNRWVLGEYALAIHEPARRRLLLCCDGLGLSPLFHAETSGGLAFASHLDTLLGLVDGGGLDTEQLGAQLLHAPQNLSRTPFRDIRRLVPGEILEWRDGRRQHRRGWQLSEVAALPPMPEAEQDERFRALLIEAVRTAVPAQGKVWAELSGGQDSSSVVAAARQAGIDHLETMSFVFSRCEEADERDCIDAMIDACAYPSHRIDVDQFPPFSALPTRFHGEPNLGLTHSAFFDHYQQQATARGVSVVLSGNGGDHVMLGDGLFPMDLADHLAQRRYGALWNGLRQWQQQVERRSLRYLFSEYAWHPWRRHRRGQAVTPRPLLARPTWVSEQVARLRPQAAGALDRAPSPSQQAYLERVWALSALLGSNQHQLSTAFEFRYPLAYRPLVEFLYALPWQQKLDASGDRVIQRRALSAWLPEAVRHRRDKAVMTRPFLEGFGRSDAWRTMLLDSPRLAALGLVDGGRWRDAVCRAHIGQVDGLSLFLVAAAAECWLKTLEQRPSARLTLVEAGEIDALTNAKTQC